MSGAPALATLAGWPLDHVAIACADLAAGEAWLADLLGAPAQGGGRHEMMGTHNRLWPLGPGEYLELVAIDAEAPAPDRPRWFGLDRFAGPPRVAGWVVAAPDSTPAPAGSAWESASRGDLRWRITLAASGVTGRDGMAPALIDWQGAAHPRSRMSDAGLRLIRLDLTHPAATGPVADPRITLSPGPPALRATIATPAGEVTL